MSNSPYPGLRPFQRNESDIFFGREEHSDQLIEQLGQTHFLAVVGPSGCGKSSLVHTGLLAGLESGYLASAGIWWWVAELRPGDHPFINLTEALLKKDTYRSYFSTDTEDTNEAAAFLQANLRFGPLSLHELLQSPFLPKKTNLLLLVDQFEEIFRYYEQIDSNEAAAFVDLLLGSSQPYPFAKQGESHRIYVVITMRSDFFGHCAQFRDLPEAINQGLFLVPRLERRQLAEAIEKPAQLFSGEVDAWLVNHLLNEISNAPDQLPVLQHALMRLWELATRTNSSQIIITREHYKKIGELSKTLSEHADEIYAELNSKQQKIAEILYRCLTEKGSHIGYLHDIRRPVPLQEVATLADVAWEEVAEVVEKFRQNGRNFLTPLPDKELKPDTVLNISHESLIRQWQRLKDWIKQEANSAELYQHLENIACLYEKRQASLLQTPEIETFLKWHHDEQPTAAWAKRYGKENGKYFNVAMNFLEESEKLHKKDERGRKKRQQNEERVGFVEWVGGVITGVMAGVLSAILVLATSNHESMILPLIGFIAIVVLANTLHDVIKVFIISLTQKINKQKSLKRTVEPSKE